jgi:LmbE family N-acetylglucosaminyl deacetylase
MAQNNLHLVAFVAHAIDEMKCVGGTFAKYVRKGHQATAVVFSRPTSRGELPDSFSIEEVVEANLVQAKKAAKVLGSNIEFFNYRYEDLSVGKDRQEMVIRTADAIRRLKPDVIFTHLLEDTSYGMMHHRVVGEVVTTACYYAGQSSLKTDNPPHKINLLLYFVSNMWTPRHFSHSPDLFIDISETAQLKHQGLMQYSSHVGSPPPSLLKEHRMVPSRMYGLASGCYFAEAFFLPFDRFGRIALDEIPREWMVLRRKDDHHEELSLPEDYDFPLK